jgi:hypothetical protein
VPYPTEDFKIYYLPTYVIWVILGPTFLLLANNPYPVSLLEIITFQASSYYIMRIFAFYLIFGLIWPLMIVIYPAFYTIIANNYGLKLFPWDTNEGFTFDFTLISIPGNVVLPLFLWLIAFYGPFVSIFISIYKHKKYIQSKQEEPLTYSKFFLNFI